MQGCQEIFYHILFKSMSKDIFSFQLHELNAGISTRLYVQSNTPAWHGVVTQIAHPIAAALRKTHRAYCMWLHSRTRQREIIFPMTNNPTPDAHVLHTRTIHIIILTVASWCFPEFITLTDMSEQVILYDIPSKPPTKGWSFNTWKGKQAST